MTKLATVRQLSDSPSPQLEILKELNALRQALESLPALQRDLSNLPEALSRELATQLQPLVAMDKSLQAMPAQLEAILQTQRRTLDAAMEHMSEQATASITKALEAAEIKELAGLLKGMHARLTQDNEALQRLESMAESLEKAKASMLQAARQVRASTPSKWALMSLIALTTVLSVAGASWLADSLGFASPRPQQSASSLNDRAAMRALESMAADPKLAPRVQSEFRKAHASLQGQ